MCNALHLTREEFWSNKLLPKLRLFYDNCVGPELVVVLGYGVLRAGCRQIASCEAVFPRLQSLQHACAPVHVYVH